uniref:Uncharacterized protein n=1 Tax=Oryza nivara TaxID=4536 RepID=A0A0E0FUW8_ORYNI
MAAQGPDRDLLLLPQHGHAARGRRLRDHHRAQPAAHPGALRRAGRRLPGPRRRLVHQGPHRAGEEPRRRQEHRPAGGSRHQRQEREGRVQPAHVHHGGRQGVPVPRLQRGDQDVAQRAHPGPQPQARGDGGLAHRAEQLRLAGRARRPVRLLPRHRRPEARRLPPRGLHPLLEGVQRHHRHRPVQRVEHAGVAQAAGGAERVGVVHQPVEVVPLEPDGERGAAQPAGVLPLRADQHHAHHQALHQQGEGGRQGAVRPQRRVARRRRPDAAQARRVLQRLLRGVRVQPHRRRAAGHHRPAEARAQRHLRRVPHLHRGRLREPREEHRLLPHQRLRLLRRRHGAGDMDAGVQEDVQPAGHGEPAHDPGVPEVVDGGDADVRQRGDVEHQVQHVGEVLPRGAVVRQRGIAGEVAPGRVQHAGDSPPLRQGRRPADAAVLPPRIIKQNPQPSSGTHPWC